MAGCVPTNYFHGETSVDIAAVLIWLKELETGEAQRRMGRWNKEPYCLCDQSNTRGSEYCRGFTATCPVLIKPTSGELYG